jgi:hypothetical protein
MGEAAEQTGATLVQIQSILDLLHGAVANINTAQLRMCLQLKHQAAAIFYGSTYLDDTVRIFLALMEKLLILERRHGISNRPPLEEMKPDPRTGIPIGRSSVQPVSPHWISNAAGASSSVAPQGIGVAIDPRGLGIRGGGVFGGIGGGGFGGVGGFYGKYAEIILTEAWYIWWERRQRTHEENNQMPHFQEISDSRFGSCRSPTTRKISKTKGNYENKDFVILKFK